MRSLVFQHGLRTIRPPPTAAAVLPSCRRTFLSIPDQKLHITRTLPYTQKQLYDLVSDVSAYHRFVPFCTTSRIVSQPPSGASSKEPFKMELTVGFMGVEQSYISNVYLTPNERVEAVASDETPIFTKLRSVWTFKQLSPVPCTTPAPTSPLSQFQSQQLSNQPSGSSSSAEPRTQFDLDLEFGFINPLHAALSSASLERVSQKMVEAFVTRCTQIYGRKEQAIK